MEAVPAVSSSVERSSQNPLISLAPRLSTISHPNKCSKLENDEISGLVPLNAFLSYFSLRVSVAYGYDKGWLQKINAWSQYGNRPESTAVRSGEQLLEQLAAR